MTPRVSAGPTSTMRSVVFSPRITSCVSIHLTGEANWYASSSTSSVWASSCSTSGRMAAVVCVGVRVCIMVDLQGKECIHEPMDSGEVERRNAGALGRGVGWRRRNAMGVGGNFARGSCDGGCVDGLQRRKGRWREGARNLEDGEREGGRRRTSVDMNNSRALTSGCQPVCLCA